MDVNRLSQNHRIPHLQKNSNFTAEETTFNFSKVTRLSNVSAGARTQGLPTPISAPSP